MGNIHSGLVGVILYQDAIYEISRLNFENMPRVYQARAPVPGPKYINTQASKSIALAGAWVCLSSTWSLGTKTRQNHVTTTTAGGCEAPWSDEAKRTRNRGMHGQLGTHPRSNQCPTSPCPLHRHSSRKSCNTTFLGRYKWFMLHGLWEICHGHRRKKHLWNGPFANNAQHSPRHPTHNRVIISDMNWYDLSAKKTNSGHLPTWRSHLPTPWASITAQACPLVKKNLLSKPRAIGTFWLTNLSVLQLSALCFFFPAVGISH